MDSVYNYLPAIIPSELHTLIHLFAGTCTPSCTHVKAYKKSIDGCLFLNKPETLWVASTMMKVPRYFMRRFENHALTIWELDLKIAIYELKHDRYVQYIIDYPDAISEYTRLATFEWTQIEIDTITTEKTRRLHEKIKYWS
jgi:hypothetical protein